MIALARNGFTDSCRGSPNSVVLFTKILKLEKEDIARDTKQLIEKFTKSHESIFDFMYPCIVLLKTKDCYYSK